MFDGVDGSTIAFFEAPGLPKRPKPAHPAYVIFDHLAFEVESPDDVRAWKDWLVANGIDVLGPGGRAGGCPAYAPVRATAS